MATPPFVVPFSVFSIFGTMCYIEVVSGFNEFRQREHVLRDVVPRGMSRKPTIPWWWFKEARG